MLVLNRTACFASSFLEENGALRMRYSGIIVVDALTIASIQKR